MKVRRYVLRAGLVALVLAGSACRDTTPDEKDTSPPTLSWRVQVEGEDERVFGANATTEVPAGKLVRLWLRVEDPGGVKEIRTSITAGRFHCRNGELAQQGTFDFAPPERVLTGTKGSDGLVPSQLSTLPPFEYTFPPQSPCQAGWTLTEYSFGAAGEGTNWAGLKATGASLGVKRSP